MQLGVSNIVTDSHFFIYLKLIIFF